ncbi:KPN_02809 family neutral zinc metallopeptidase [Dongia deserti]|uniref:KPN_02809 family neutral zinc metallopeptidase n=1 Tax=Dongia deserti TaxID=2268030 RepID=UPI000E64984E|nr:neutral zinc metallopeptidase [Dongia deserti]
MLWKGRRQSRNIEDRRGMGGMRFPGGLGGGLGGGYRRGGMRGGGLGLGGIIILFIIAWALGINPLALLSGDFGSGSYIEQQTAGGGTFSSPQEEDLKQFVAVVLADTEDTWHHLLPEIGAQYREPKLVLFSGGAQSGCGFAQSAVGPFYCPADEKVYLDLTFFDELSRRFGAPGDFAQAYVIAHEVGHHVQTVLGIEEQVSRARAGMSQSESNALSVRVELQADCFAGVWANRAHQERGLIERGDIEEALTAASAVGDDTLQKRSSGRVVPDSFTHGSAAQRVRWFETGYRSGNITDCDTFRAKTL